MKTCQICKRERVIHIYGKTADCFWLKYKDNFLDGYPPTEINISKDGDSIELYICLDCGRVQGKFPISEQKINQILEENR